MSGGIAFVYDVRDEFTRNCNPEMVDIDPASDNGDKTLLRELLEEHIVCTSSKLASFILADLDNQI